MSREIDPRFPPKRNLVSLDRQNWVVIGLLPEDQQAEFWKRVKQNHPDIVQMRRNGAKLIKALGAVFQVTEKKFNEIMVNK